MKQIAFVNADKYVLALPYHDVAPFKPHETIRVSYGTFYDSGEYTIHPGFLFSANWPAINTFNTRRAACAHDFFYSLMKDGHLPRSYRDQADYLLYDMLREDGMPSFRAYYWLKAVQIGGDDALNNPKQHIQYSPVENKPQEQQKFGMK